MRVSVLCLLALEFIGIVHTDASADSRKKNAHDRAIKLLADGLVQHSQSAQFNDGLLEGVEYFEGELPEIVDKLPLTATWIDPRDPKNKAAIKIVIDGAPEDDKLVGDKSKIDPPLKIFKPMLVEFGGVEVKPAIALCKRQYVGPYSKIERANKAERKALHKKAVAVAGHWNHASGAYIPYNAANEEAKRFTISCLSGIVGKCAHWGYIPNATFKATGTSLTPYHEACVRAARAMYDTTNSRSYTCRNTVIDIYDNLRMKKSDRNPDLQFESVWIKNGMTIEMKLAAPRFNENCSSEPNIRKCAAADNDCKDPYDDTTWNSESDKILVIRSDLDTNESSTGDCPGKLVKGEDPACN